VTDLETEPTSGLTPVEQRLRAALRARIEMIEAEDLRLAAASASPAVPSGSARARRCDPAVAMLSMLAGREGTTDPLAWYPAPDGLHWLVDRCAVAACTAGQPAAVLPWDSVGG